MGIFRDKVIVNRHYNETTITEKRAPTDESVKLLKEMEEKAERKFIDRIDIETNILNYTVLEYAEDITTACNKFRYFVNINGKDYYNDVSVDRHELMNSPMALLNVIQKDLANLISKDIVVHKINNQEYDQVFKHWNNKK